MLDWSFIFDVFICWAGWGSTRTPYMVGVEEEARERKAMMAEYKATWEARYR